MFAVKPSLLRTFVERSAEDPERPAGVDGEWVSLENDIVLAPGEDRGLVDPGRTAWRWRRLAAFACSSAPSRARTIMADPWLTILSTICA